MKDIEIAGICLIMVLIGGIFGFKIGFNIMAKTISYTIKKYKPEMFKDFKEIHKKMREKR